MDKALSDEGLLRPRVARAREINRSPSTCAPGREEAEARLFRFSESREVDGLALLVHPLRRSRKLPF